MNTDWAALTRQVKDANDIVAVVGSYLTVHPAGRTFKALCPFHNDHRPSLDVDPERQRFRCWACGKFGDVFTFVQEMDKVDFRQAREILARRVGISLEPSKQDESRVRMLDLMKWAETLYHECLFESEELAAQARIYLGERKLKGETLRTFGVGYAPLPGDWLVERARKQGKNLEILVELGLIAERKESGGFYDRFRDRVMFPIRDVRGQTVGFGGRILPSSPYASRSPKYYNSTETPLFNKSELLFGLDKARHAGAAAGYLVVMEGYTDVMMAHQCGVLPVVATMGTALNSRHVNQLRRIVPKVILVFDADEGGATGVDRALEIFISQDVELLVASLPESLDPCDWLVQSGPEPFKLALTNAVDALDFKLHQLLEKQDELGTQRMLDSILGILALSSDAGTSAQRVKQELIISRIAHRLGLRQETVWARLADLKASKRRDADRANDIEESVPQKRSAPAPPLEKQLLQLLLAEPALVNLAKEEIAPEEITHPGLRKLLVGLYTLRSKGEPPDLEGLRVLIEQPELISSALKMQEVGRMINDRATWLQTVLDGFRQARIEANKRTLQNRLSAATDLSEAVELLKKLQNPSKDSES